MLKFLSTLLIQAYIKAFTFMRDFVASFGTLMREAFGDAAPNSKNKNSQRKDSSDNDDYFFLPPA